MWSLSLDDALNSVMVCAYNSISAWNKIKSLGYLKLCHRDAGCEFRLSVETNSSGTQQMKVCRYKERQQIKVYEYKEKKVLSGSSLCKWESMILSKHLNLLKSFFAILKLLCTKSIFVACIFLMIPSFKESWVPFETDLYSSVQWLTI